MTGGIASVPDRTEVVLFVVALIVAGSLGVLGPWQAGTGLANDPCRVRQGESYVPTGGPIEDASDLGRAVVYVSKYESGDGPDCVRRTLDSGDRTELAGVTIAVDGDGAVRVAGDRLESDGVWQSWRTTRSITDPWYDHHRQVLLTAAGSVEGVRTTADRRSADHRARLVVGSVRTTRSLNPITASIFLGATFLVVGIPLEWSTRAVELDEWND